MATLAERGRIRVSEVEAEQSRLERAWRTAKVEDSEGDLLEVLGGKGCFQGCLFGNPENQSPQILILFVLILLHLFFSFEKVF